MSFLHITNGSAITPFMRQAGIVGPIVPWDDVLHEGPVRAGFNVVAMRDARADFLASCGWGSRDEIVRSLAARDAALENLGRVDEIVLWFEHDLYDQLQILQILDRLPLDGGPSLTAVPSNDYLVGLMPGLKPGPADGVQADSLRPSAKPGPADGVLADSLRPSPKPGPAGQHAESAGTARSHSAGPARSHSAGPARSHSAGPARSHSAGPGFSPGRPFSDLFAARREVTSSQRIAARDAWDAFRSEDPRALVDVLQRVMDLPHLPAALRRHLQQFPSTRNGLSRTEQQVLEAISRGVTRLDGVFMQANHQSEEAVFMGDAAFLFHLRGLMQGSRPLMRVVNRGLSHSTMSLEDELTLTDDGRRVLAGDADRVTLCSIDRWLGGVHVRGRGPVWRWHHARGTVVNV